MTRQIAECGTEVGSHDLQGKLDRHDPAAQAEHIEIVMLDALVGRIRVVADGGPDPGHLRGRHGGTDTAAADEDSAVGLIALDRPAQPDGEVGVVVSWIRAVAAEIDQLVGASLGAQADKELILEGGPAVIGRKGNAHRQSGLAGTGLAPELPVALIGWPRPNPAGW